MVASPDLAPLENRLSQLSAREGLALVSKLYPSQVVFSTSLGQEDQVITELIASQFLPITIFTLDTGRLFEETLDLLATTESKYKKRIEVYYPQTERLQTLVADQGINGFYDTVQNRKSCCNVRKVEPLKRALEGKKIWITGIRADQSPNRSQMKRIEWDESNQIIKYNPLMDWTYQQTIAYIQAHHIPYNPLHDKGFMSIGCTPCTRAIVAGEDPRAGRWWWEMSKKECGLHAK